MFFEYSWTDVRDFAGARGSDHRVAGEGIRLGQWAAAVKGKAFTPPGS